MVGVLPCQVKYTIYSSRVRWLSESFTIFHPLILLFTLKLLTNIIPWTATWGAKLPSPLFWCHFPTHMTRRQMVLSQLGLSHPFDLVIHRGCQLCTQTFAGRGCEKRHKLLRPQSFPEHTRDVELLHLASSQPCVSTPRQGLWDELCLSTY